MTAWLPGACGPGSHESAGRLCGGRRAGPQPVVSTVRIRSLIPVHLTMRHISCTSPLTNGWNLFTISANDCIFAVIIMASFCRPQTDVPGRECPGEWLVIVAGTTAWWEYPFGCLFAQSSTRFTQLL